MIYETVGKRGFIWWGSFACNKLSTVLREHSKHQFSAVDYNHIRESMYYN